MGDSLMDFSERCRLCIEPKRLSIGIFSEEGRRIKLKSKINKNLPLKVSQSDGLPSQICYQCLFRLETWVSFKQLCVERDQVMKTWSQSYMDETSCEVENFNGHQKSCKVNKTKGSDAPRERSHSNSLGLVGRQDDLVSGNQMDDAKSDTSVWEVVKMDDADNMDCETHDRDISKSRVGTISTSDYAMEGKHDWSRRKSRKPSKVPSSSSDASMGNDADTSCTDVGAHPVDSLSSSLTSPPSPYKPSPNGKDSSPNLSPLPVKRKRGRPSKAFLQRERELKKQKNHDKLPTDGNEALSHDETVSNQSVQIEPGRDEVPNENAREDFDVIHDVRPNILTPEFTPVERDDGSGVTEVVLDDPEVGSMKFTLSIVQVDSPTSSPNPADSYNYYNYASSSGNLSTDSLHREDFEGFESPHSSSSLRPALKDDHHSSSDEMPRSRSQVDVRLIVPEDVLPSSTSRTRSNSASGGFRMNCSISNGKNVDDQQESFSNNVSFNSCPGKNQQISKSFENLNIVDKSSRLYRNVLDERNAYSDGELSESPNKQTRRKSLPPL